MTRMLARTSNRRHHSVALASGPCVKSFMPFEAPVL